MFYLGSGRIKRKFDREQLNALTGIEPILFQPSDPYAHVQHPTFEEESAPFIEQVVYLTTLNPSLFIIICQGTGIY